MGVKVPDEMLGEFPRVTAGEASVCWSKTWMEEGLFGWNTRQVWNVMSQGVLGVKPSPPDISVATGTDASPVKEIQR